MTQYSFNLPLKLQQESEKYAANQVIILDDKNFLDIIYFCN